MRLYDLLESSYKDIYPKGLIDFIDNKSKKYNNDVFIYFTNDKNIAYSNKIEGSSPLGVECYPVQYFSNNPTIFSKIINKHRYFKIISPKGKFLKIDDIKKAKMESILYNVGIENPQQSYEDFIKENRKSSYGMFLFYALTHEITDGAINSDNENTISKLKDNLINLNFNGVYDTSKSVSDSILSERYSSVCYFFTNFAKTIETIDMHHEKSEEQDFSDKDTIRKLASNISTSIGTSLNSDDGFNEGMNYYFWTKEGIQIRITTIIGNSTNNKTTDTKFIIDIETPYGVLYYTSSTNDSFDDIGNNISRQYSKMNIPLDDWEPKNVDIFLSRYEAEYKDIAERMDDIIEEVGKFYPMLRQYARQYNIEIPELTFYNERDRIYIDGIMQMFRESFSARKFLEKISNNEEDIDVKNLKNYFPRNLLPKKMSYNTLKKMAITYDIAKKAYPNKSGWPLFSKK